jgi:hypothetical protein
VPGGYNWATQSPGDINIETWSSRLGVGRGADDPTPEKSTVRKPKMWPRNNQINYRDDWEKSIKEVKVQIGLQSHLRRREEESVWVLM